MWQWMGSNGWGWMGGTMLFGGLFWLVLLALGVVAVMWVVRTQGSGSTGSPSIERKSTALDILEERYAKGEIHRDEYVEKKRDLGG